MAYRDTGGNGIPVIFLHGSGCDSDDWDGVLSMLAPGLRSIRMDFRGHGASDTPSGEFTLDELATDVLALADHLAIEKAVVVGHSLGGMVALAVASRSSVAAALVLLEGWTALRAAEAFVGNRFHGMLPPEIIGQIQQKSADTRARFVPEIWQAFWATVVSFDARQYLDTAVIPIWELYGEMGKTDAMPQQLLVPYRKNIQLCWMLNCGHYLPQENPLDVASIIIEAWKKVKRFNHERHEKHEK